jgi:hypothetical protein
MAGAIDFVVVLLFLLSPPAPGTPANGLPREPVELAISTSPSTSAGWTRSAPGPSSCAWDTEKVKRTEGLAVVLAVGAAP